MGKLKVHELAKELGMESKELITKAKEIGIEVTSHLSSLEEEQVNKIKDILKKNENKGVKAQKSMEQEKNKEKKEKNSKKEATPVIIRREVILADEEKQEKKQEKSDRKDVGFVERKENKDFNTPVIALTADAVAGAKEKYVSEGFIDYIAKPFSRDQIKEKLDSIFLNNTKEKEEGFATYTSDSSTKPIDNSVIPITDEDIERINKILEEKKNERKD